MLGTHLSKLTQRWDTGLGGLVREERERWGDIVGLGLTRSNRRVEGRKEGGRKPASSAETGGLGSLRVPGARALRSQAQKPLTAGAQSPTRGCFSSFLLLPDGKYMWVCCKRKLTGMCACTLTIKMYPL